MRHDTYECLTKAEKLLEDSEETAKNLGVLKSQEESAAYAERIQAQVESWCRLAEARKNCNLS